MLQQFIILHGEHESKLAIIESTAAFVRYFSQFCVPFKLVAAFMYRFASRRVLTVARFVKSNTQLSRNGAVWLIKRALYKVPGRSFLRLLFLAAVKDGSDYTADKEFSSKTRQKRSTISSAFHAVATSNEVVSSLLSTFRLSFILEVGRCEIRKARRITTLFIELFTSIEIICRGL